MVIVAGTIKVNPNQRADFLASTVELVAATLAEHGCQAYTFSADPINEDNVNLFEVWEDNDALDTHLASTHLVTWYEQNGNTIEEKDTKRYQVSSVGPVRN